MTRATSTQLLDSREEIGNSTSSELQEVDG
jgi:hypothetical protein